MRVKSMRGVMLDMSQLVAKNEKKAAVGNAKMNARGDIIGSGGKVIKKREQITKDYYTASPKAVKQVPLRSIAKEMFETPAEAAKAYEDVLPHNKQATPPQQAPKQHRRKIEDRD